MISARGTREVQVVTAARCTAPFAQRSNPTCIGPAGADPLQTCRTGSTGQALIERSSSPQPNPIPSAANNSWAHTSTRIFVFMAFADAEVVPRVGHATFPSSCPCGAPWHIHGGTPRHDVVKAYRPERGSLSLAARTGPRREQALRCCVARAPALRWKLAALAAPARPLRRWRLRPGGELGAHTAPDPRGSRARRPAHRRARTPLGSNATATPSTPAPMSASPASPSKAHRARSG